MKLYRIKKSNIDKNGKGLYATKDIKKGTRIIDYVGNIITRKQSDENPKFESVKLNNSVTPSNSSKTGFPNTSNTCLKTW